MTYGFLNFLSLDSGQFQIFIFYLFIKTQCLIGDFFGKKKLVDETK